MDRLIYDNVSQMYWLIYDNVSQMGRFIYDNVSHMDWLIYENVIQICWLIYDVSHMGWLNYDNVSQMGWLICDIVSHMGWLTYDNISYDIMCLTLIITCIYRPNAVAYFLYTDILFFMFCFIKYLKYFEITMDSIIIRFIGTRWSGCCTFDREVRGSNPGLTWISLGTRNESPRFNSTKVETRTLVS